MALTLTRQKTAAQVTPSVRQRKMQFLVIHNEGPQAVAELFASACKERGFTRVDFVSRQPQQEYKELFLGSDQVK